MASKPRSTIIINGIDVSRIYPDIVLPTYKDVPTVEDASELISVATEILDQLDIEFEYAEVSPDLKVVMLSGLKDAEPIEDEYNGFIDPDE